MLMFRVESARNVRYLNPLYIVAIETPAATGKPVGWCDDIAAIVQYVGCQEHIGLRETQWQQLKALLKIEDA